MDAVLDPAAEAVAKEQDRLVQTPEGSTLYMARRSELRLVLERMRSVRNSEGDEVDIRPGVTVEFREGILRVPTEGPCIVADGREVDGAEIVSQLERHRRKGDLEGGFWRVDPTAPPVSKEELDTLVRLAISLDVAGIEAYIAQERAGWNRDELVSSAQEGLERVRGAIVAAEAAGAANAAAESKGK